MNLFPYQNEGADWLAGRRHALLGDEMGLGKSAQAIVGADRAGLRRILVICPSVAKRTWQKEFAQWESGSRRFQVLDRLSERVEAGVDAAAVSFDYALKNFEHLKEAGPWDLVVIDEVHFLKSIEAKRSQNVFGSVGIIRAAKRVWVLSGTPAPNHAGELWILLYTFGVTRLSYAAFIREFCTSYMTGFGQTPRITGTKIERAPELRQMLSKIMLRRKKVDVLKDLPDITFGEIDVEPCEVDLDGEPSFVQWVFPLDRRKELETQLSREQALIDGLFSLQNLDENRIKAMEGLATSVSTLRRYNGLQKVEGVAKLVEEEFKIGLYQKLVIFALHQGVIEGLRRKLRVYHPVTLYGGTPAEKREAHVERFQRDPKCKLFIGNILAAGTNITLTSAHHVLFVEQDWVPANNAQAAMRCHRIGQKRNVTVRFVSLNSPLDQRVTHILRKKTHELAEIFD